MNEIWYKNEETGVEDLLIPNIELAWTVPSVGTAWGPFVVVESKDVEGEVVVQIIQNLADDGPDGWKIVFQNPIWLENPYWLTKKMALPALIPTWDPPEKDCTWGPFKVVEVDESRRTVLLEPDPNLLTEMP